MKQTFYIAKCNDTNEFKPFWFCTLKDEAGELRKEMYEKETDDDATVVEVEMIEVVKEKMPHFDIDVDSSRPVWVTYHNGVQTTEPYRHQDGLFINMCINPRYCRCSE